MATQKATAAAVSTNEQPNPSRDSFRLSHHAVQRALRIKLPDRKNRKRKRENTGFGLIAVNILAAVASYATDANMTCWPSAPAIARDTGYSEEVVSYVLAQFEKAGIFIRKERWKQSTLYIWIRSDAPSGYTILNRKWWQRHTDLGEARGLYVILHASSDGRLFTMNVKQDCLLKFGTSHAKFYRLLPALKGNGMVRTQVVQDGTRFKVEVSQRAGFIKPDVSQRAEEPSQRAAEVSQRAVSGVSAGGVKGKASQKQVLDFEVKAHKNEDFARKTCERPASHFSNFKTESKSKALATDIVTGAQLAECYRQCYQRKFGVPCPWDDGDEQAAARTVARLSGWAADAFERCFENLFKSKDGRATKKASYVFRYLHEYIKTALNRFGGPLTSKDLTMEERLELALEECGQISAEAQERTTQEPEPAPEPKPDPEPSARPERIEATVAVTNYCPSPFQATIRLDEGLGGSVRCWVTDQIQQGMLAAAYEQETLVTVVYVNDAKKPLIVSVIRTAKASPRRAAREAAAVKRHRDNVAHEILLDEELCAWEKWDGINSDDERWADEDPVRDRAVARDNADRDVLSKLEQEAMSSPEFQGALAARLAETDELRQRRRQRQEERQRIHIEHRRERERERKRREWREEQEQANRELAAIAVRREQARASRISRESNYADQET